MIHNRSKGFDHPENQERKRDLEMKRIFTAALAALLILTLAACGADSAKTVDVQALADALKSGVAFEDTLSAVSADELAFSLSGMPENYTAAAYRASGTTSEEIIAVQCGNKDDAAMVKAALETHLAEVKDQASKYQPEEVARLDGAILTVSGSCVALCVTADTDTANSIIKEYVG